MTLIQKILGFRWAASETHRSNPPLEATDLD